MKLHYSPRIQLAVTLSDGAAGVRESRRRPREGLERPWTLNGSREALFVRQRAAQGLP